MQIATEKRPNVRVSENGEQRFISTSPEETQRIGMELARELRPGSVVALFGELGSGKTTLIAGVCRGLGVSGDVTSPTFTLIHEYAGNVPVYHFDFFRIEHPAEIRQLGWEEYVYGDGVCLIEWADRVADFLPKKRIEIYLENRFHQGRESEREIVIRKL